uniref:LRRNT domain-containing protein n=1 Tax=Angiostrongylus cantonensis TaxID=6313 RepID=A0A0K0CWT5_ANGCA
MSLLLLLLFLVVGNATGCQKGCDCSSSVTVCHAQSLKSVPILLDPRTRRLDLAHNRITRLTNDELSLYPIDFGFKKKAVVKLTGIIPMPNSKLAGQSFKMMRSYDEKRKRVNRHGIDGKLYE